MSNNHQLPLSVQPIISYPREAEVGKTYLMTIDLQTSGHDWPYEEEEYPTYCMLETSPLFSSKPVGESAVVLHRFGGSYGAAQFLLTAPEKESEGEIRITLVNGWGVPVRGLNLTEIKVKQAVKLNLLHRQGGMPVRGLNLIQIEDNQQLKLNPLLLEPQSEQELLIAIIDQLWGLLIDHHCNNIRKWHLWEFDFLNQVATQLSIAIQQALTLINFASTDGLTQVANRRRFDEYLNELWRSLALRKAPLSLILCDIDFLNSYNRTYGHLAGDICLQQIAKALTLAVKHPEDLVARYGGEEFVVLLPNVEVKEAAQVAEAIRSEVEALKIPHSNSRISEYITISSGVSSIVPNSESSPGKLIMSADIALYQAKQQGRDRIVVASSNIP